MTRILTYSSVVIWAFSKTDRKGFVAEILVAGTPREYGSSNLRIDFTPQLAFRRNHDILTPGLVGVVQIDPEQRVNAYLPCRDEADAALLANTSVTFERLARFEREFYVDVRDFDDYWSKLPRALRPPSFTSKAYTLPQGGPNTDGAAIRSLIVADIAQASWNLIADFEQQQTPADSSSVECVDLNNIEEPPVTQALRLAQSLGQVIINNPAFMFESRAELHPHLEQTAMIIKLLDHLRDMSPFAQRHALILPPEDTWRAVILDMQVQSRGNSAGHPALDSGAAGG